MRAGLLTTINHSLRPILWPALGLLLLADGCGPARDTRVPAKPIEQVLAEQKADLMKIPGVEGVYSSKLEDGSPCLKVMVNERTPEVRTGIPNRIEGYPIVIENLEEIYGKREGNGGM